MKQGWEIKKLGEVCELSAGGDVPKDNFSETKTEKYNIPIYANGEKNEGLYGYTNIAKVSKPSITVSARGTIGFSVKRLEAFFPVVRLIVVTPKNQKELDLNFLDYSLKRIDFKHSGSSIPQLTVPMIRDYEIPLPPLPEQQRIVSILDEAFAAIAKAKANAEQNLKNTKELFESYLQGVFEKKGDGWEECNLEDNIKLIDYRGRTPQKTESGVRLITAKNVKLGFLQLEPQEFIAEDNYESWMTRGIPNVGDVIFTTEAPLANVAQIESNEKLAFAQRIIVMQPNRKKLNPTFLKYMLLSIPIRNKILGKGTGATVFGIKSSLLKKIPIYFPKSIEEQQTIVRQLDALRAETQKLEAVYQQKIDDLEELKKSIMQKAFAGELKTEKLETV